MNIDKVIVTGCVLYVNLLLLVPLNVCHLFDCAYFFTSIMKGLFPVNTICTGLWWLPEQLMWIWYIYHKKRILMSPPISCVHGIDTALLYDTCSA